MRRRLVLFLVLLPACAQEDESPVPAPSQALPAQETEAPLNHLAHEKSIYLLQHADNPVDWYPWGPEAFAKAQREDKPIFLSIGYSSCHWCHVMEHETFADAEVAAVLNEHFVSIKVDREERPDVDDVYMKAVVYGMRIGGGWPLSVWLTPEGKPFWGGTYYPKRTDPRFGQPGFLDLCQRIAELWTDPEERQKIEQQGEHFAAIPKAVYDFEEPATLGPTALKDAFATAAQAYDAEWGGFGGPPAFAPKFPMPGTLETVLRHALRQEDAQARALVLDSLDRMACGGIHDRIGGGFHRYSTTRDWLVPHFEKMLYDNAQLLPLYAWAHLVTGEERYAATARDIAAWVRREMTDARGGFYAAQDADDPGGPEGEGGFYVWDPAEMEALFGAAKARILCAWFGITEGGNWPEKPGKSLLQVRRTAADVAAEFGIGEAELRALVAGARAKMYEARERRPKPITDTKVLTSWSALMVSGLCRAHQALGDEDLLAAAVKGGTFLRTAMVRDGRVLRRWADGEAGIDGVLDDYAFLVAAFLDLYETTFDVAWLEAALRLARTTDELFGDAEGGGWFFTAHDAEALLARGKSGGESALPSGNGVMAMNLLRIGELTGDLDAGARALKALEHFGTQAAASPLGYSAVLNALDFAQPGTREIFIAGDPAAPATRRLVEAVWRNPDPNRVIAVVTPGLAQVLPPAEGKVPVKGQPAAYVCRNFVCEAPTTDPAALGGE